MSDTSSDSDSVAVPIGVKRPAGPRSKQANARRVPSHSASLAALQAETAALKAFSATGQPLPDHHQGSLGAYLQMEPATLQRIIASKEQLIASTSALLVLEQQRKHDGMVAVGARRLQKLVDHTPDVDCAKLGAVLDAALEAARDPRPAQPYTTSAFDDNLAFRGRVGFTNVVRAAFDQLDPTTMQKTLALVCFTASGCGKTRAVLQLTSTLNAAAPPSPRTRVIYIGINCNSGLDGTEDELMQFSAFLPRVLCRRVLAALMGPDEASPVGALMVPRLQGLFNDAPLPPLEALYDAISRHLVASNVQRLVVALDELQLLKLVDGWDTGARIAMRALRVLQQVVYQRTESKVKVLPIGTGIRADAFEPDGTMGSVECVMGSGDADDDSTLLNTADYVAVWQSHCKNDTPDAASLALRWPRVREIVLPSMVTVVDDARFDEVIVAAWCKQPVDIAIVPRACVVRPSSRHTGRHVYVVLDGNIQMQIVDELIRKNRCSGNLHGFLNAVRAMGSMADAMRKQLYGFWSLVLVTEVAWGLARTVSKSRGIFTVPPALLACITKTTSIRCDGVCGFDAVRMIEPTSGCEFQPYTSREKNELCNAFTELLTKRHFAALHYGDGSNAHLDAIFLFPTDRTTADGRPVTKLLAVAFKTSAMDTTAVANTVLFKVTKLAADCNNCVKSVHVTFDWFVLTADEALASNCYDATGYYVPPYTNLLFAPAPAEGSMRPI